MVATKGVKPVVIGVLAISTAILCPFAATSAAQEQPFTTTADVSEFSPDVILDQNWRRKPKNMSVLDVPGVAGSIMMWRPGLLPNGEIGDQWQYQTSNLPQESYNTELLDEVLYDQMISVSDTTGLSVSHPIFNIGVDFSDADMVRLTIKRVFRKSAPSLSDDDALAELTKMAEQNFGANPDERFFWVKAVEMRTVTLEKFKEVKKAGSAGFFFFGGKKAYQMTEKSTAVREIIGLDILSKRLSDLQYGTSRGFDDPSSGEEAISGVIDAMFSADVPFEVMPPPTER